MFFVRRLIYVMKKKCNLRRPICAAEFMSVGRQPTCLSAEEIDDVSTGITYKYIVRRKYLRIPFAKIFRYFPSIDMWKEVKNVWNRHGRAMKIAPSSKSAGHLFLITSIAISQRYLFKFRGWMALISPQQQQRQDNQQI